MALSQSVAQGNADEEDDELTLPVYHQQDDLLSLVHVALMIRADLRETPGYKGLDMYEETIEEKENEVRRKARAVAQDIVYEAGHILSYDQILQLDRCLAESILNTLDEESGTAIPPNLVQGNFVHISADNIDILDETLDESMDKIETIVARKINPVFIKAVKTTWYDQAEDKKECKQAAKATDLAFNMLRSEGVIRSDWTEFNQSPSRGEFGDKSGHEVTNTGRNQ
ncbi:Hypothetical predicted protein [Paramuricea clavata]|uniref:Uncharacterized protein n=1 Tax=Paramuricea clavata TaxID=317549 RepID=A0A6S7GZI9_PARCT|nr:Hypothetical predicted protein [Paramuricea clavata]